jgi:hypothetical protein
MLLIAQKGGGVFEGITLWLCEHPLPPIAAVLRGNYYTRVHPD